MKDLQDFLKIAEKYLDSGLCVLPASRDGKMPIHSVGKWGRFRERMPSEFELATWMSNGCDGLCILCGKISGNLEVLDFDRKGEAFSKWESLVERENPELFEKLLVESTQSGGFHVAYRCEEYVSGNGKLAECVDENTGEIQTLIETRGNGGLVICSPTEGYEVLQGSWTNLPVITSEERQLLLAAAVQLNECRPEDNCQEPESNIFSGAYDENSLTPGDDYNNRGDIRELLTNYGWKYLYTKGENEFWRRPGKTKGSASATYSSEKKVFYVFSSNASPFEHFKGYSPFGVYALLEHGGDYSSAASELRSEGFGDNDYSKIYPDVDISKILAQVVKIMADIEPKKSDIEDPGLIPEKLFEVPGFISDVMDFTLNNAPYPNVGLAFCGAVALQSFLCGRKVRTIDDMRPNIFLLALASSGTGKDFPRKVNSNILFKSGMINALGDKFASGEGIQDALYRSNAMLFQNDEMDGVLRQINTDRDNVRDSIPTVLLTLYTASNDIYPLRVRANQSESLYIDQPHMTLFGTATPQFFYESLSQRMLTNGLFARMIIIDVGTRGEGKTPGSPSNIPQNILDVARYWAKFIPPQSAGNLANLNPIPKVVPYTCDAIEAIEAFQKEADANWREADESNDEAARTAWSRCCENAKKLALIHACSENHLNPQISINAVEWAGKLAKHQTRRQLYLASTYVAENAFHAECLRLIQKLKVEPQKMISHSALLKRMKMSSKAFQELITTLIQSRQIEVVSTPTGGRPINNYRLLVG